MQLSVYPTLPWVDMLGTVAPEVEDERTLIERAKHGDRKALGNLLMRYGPALYRHVLLPRLGSETAAKDALHETYERVIERLHTFEWQGKGIYPWLRTIAFRMAIDHIRARKRTTLFEPEDLERELSETDTEPTPEARLFAQRDEDRARAKVEAALQMLNPRYREAIRLRILEEKPRDVVAEKMGVSVATFDVLLHRSLTALKKALSSGGCDDEG